MPSGFKQMFGDLGKLYGELNTNKKVIIGSVLALMITGFVYLIAFADMVDYDYLFTNINEDDAGGIVNYLKEKNIPFKLESRAVMVPRQKVHELRMQLAAEGLPKGEGVGFEVFDKQKLGTSKFVQDLNLKRALQGELARTISQLEKVEIARVHLVMPKKTLFKEDAVEPSASVVVKMKENQKLTGDEVKSMIHLVSSAVENLNPKNITIIDSGGKMLSRAANENEESIFGSTPLEYKKNVERDLAGRVEEVVSHMVGSGKVVAKVTVELDFKKEEKTEEMFDPDQVVVRSERRIKEARKNDENVAGGVPGTQSNTPQGPETAGNQTSNSERERQLVNYEINKVVRHTVRAAGDVKRLSVAVLVDGTYEQKDVDGELQNKYVSRSPEELDKITALVKRVVGYSGIRGDEVAVTNVPFETSILDSEESPQTFLEKYDFIPQVLRYGIILVLAMVMVFFLFRPLVEWVISFHEEERLRDIERQQEDVVKSMEEQLMEVRQTIETTTVEHKNKVKELATQAPEMVASVVRAWINAEE